MANEASKAREKVQVLKQVVLDNPAVCAGDTHANTPSGAIGCTVNITKHFNNDSVIAMKTLYLTSFVHFVDRPSLTLPHCMFLGGNVSPGVWLSPAKDAKDAGKGWKPNWLTDAVSSRAMNLERIEKWGWGRGGICSVTTAEAVRHDYQQSPLKLQIPTPGHLLPHPCFNFSLGAPSLIDHISILFISFMSVSLIIMWSP